MTDRLVGQRLQRNCVSLRRAGLFFFFFVLVFEGVTQEARESQVGVMGRDLKECDAGPKKTRSGATVSLGSLPC